MIKNNFLLLVLFLFLSTSFSQKVAAFQSNIDTISTVEKVMVDVSDSITKVVYENNFQQKYKSSEFIYTQKKLSVSIFQRFMNWLSQKLASLFQVSNPAKAESYAINFIKFLALLIVLTAVYFIIKIILNKEGRWIFGKSKQNKTDYDAIDENLQNIDFKALIEQTNAVGNNRLEIRYYYLWVLKKLADKNYIVLHAEKTNLDYYNEISSESTKVDFKYVSYLYNYIWYGEFDLTAEMYQNANKAFEKMLQNL